MLRQDSAYALKTDAIAIAKSQWGVKEEPPGSNRGRAVNKYLESVGLPPGCQWCASYVQWAFRAAANHIDIVFNMIKSGHSLTILKYAKIYKSWIEYKPKEGDWIIFRRGETQGGHTALVLSSDEKYIYVIEGNVSNTVKYSRYGLNKFGWLKIAGYVGFE